MTETWLILGATSIIARHFAAVVTRDGHRVLLAGRDLEELGRTAADLRLRTGRSVEVLGFDVGGSPDNLLSRCGRVSGRLNVLLAIGAMEPQAVLENDPRLRRRVMDANYLGPACLLIDLAQLLRRRGGGRIVALSSVAGDRVRRSNYIYGSAKAALSAFTEGLTGRCFAEGVSVTTVKLGYVDTRMTFGLPAGDIAAAPEAAASAIYRAARAGKEIAYVPWFWRWIMLLIRAVPAPIFKRIAI